MSRITPPAPRPRPRPLRLSLEPRPPFLGVGGCAHKKRSEICCATGPHSSKTKGCLVVSIDPKISEAEAQVLQHNAVVVRSGADRTCYVELCARCKASKRFAPHDVRRRGLRIVLENAVLCLTIWLARWRCRNCRHVFTDYPDFRTPVQTLCGLLVAGAGSNVCGAR